MHEEFSVPTALWERLAPAWGRMPLLIKNALPSPLASADELFEALCCWTDAAEERANSCPVVWLDGAELPADFKDFLPSRRDASLGAFARRLQRRVPGRDVQLYFKSGVHAHHTELGVRCREVLRSLPRSLGIPPGGVDVEAFCGIYSRTSTGIHRDQSDNLSFVVDGRKKMLFWPAETFSHLVKTVENMTHERLGTVLYEEYLEQALCLSGEPGDIIYWPRSYWHIAVSEAQEWSATLNLTMWWNMSPIQAILRALEMSGLVAGDARPQPFPLTSGLPQEDAASLPEIISAALASFRGVVGSPQLDLVMKETWARIVSNDGLLVPPQPLPKPRLSGSEYVRGDARFPLVILPLDDRFVSVICAGHGLRVERCDGFEKLLEAVRSGKTVPLGSLLEEPAGEKTGAFEEPDGQRRKLLEFLISNRALRVVKS